MKTQAIIPTAGIGNRFNSQVPKPLVLLQGKPLFIYCLEAIEKSNLVDSIILVAQEEHFDEFEKFIKEYQLQKISRIAAGGATRCESVYNGINVLDENTELVLIHDGVRPLVTTELIDEMIEYAQDHKAVIAAVAVKPTIKKVDQKQMLVNETLERDGLWEMQTPQLFKKDIIMEAHNKGKGSNPTDDASLVENIGCPVKVFEGDYKNIKVTTEEDLIMAGAFLNGKVALS